MPGDLTAVSVSGLVTIQDHGRRGLGSMGVGVSGAADRGSHDRANRLVGNLEPAATLEITMGRVELLASRATWVSLGGAPARAWAAGRPIPMNTRIALRAGDELEVDHPRTGLRTYVAVRGGIAVPRVLGSRSTDTLGGIGPKPVVAGAVLPVGTECGPFPLADFIADRTSASDVVRLQLALGPRDDWFSSSAIAEILGSSWTVNQSSNRIGVRLDGPRLERLVPGELASEGVVVGSVQVPPSGPIVFLDDHPVTGGYPVIGVVERSSLDLLAQVRPGQQVRFYLRHLASPLQPELVHAPNERSQ